MRCARIAGTDMSATDLVPAALRRSCRNRRRCFYAGISTLRSRDEKQCRAVVRPESRGCKLVDSFNCYILVFRGLVIQELRLAEVCSEHGQSIRSLAR